jgi:hypothetical protein
LTDWLLRPKPVSWVTTPTMRTGRVPTSTTWPTGPLAEQALYGLAVHHGDCRPVSMSRSSNSGLGERHPLDPEKVVADPTLPLLVLLR